MDNRQVDLETPAISVLAAASKTPFLTAFKVTAGIGLARFILFIGALFAIVLAINLLK
jgi:hypothetical protein